MLGLLSIIFSLLSGRLNMHDKIKQEHFSQFHLKLYVQFNIESFIIAQCPLNYLFNAHIQSEL